MPLTFSLKAFFSFDSPHRMTVYILIIYPVVCQLIVLVDARQFYSWLCCMLSHSYHPRHTHASLLSMLTARHALFTAKLKYRARSRGCMLRQLNRGGAVTTAESVCHTLLSFFFFP